MLGRPPLSQPGVMIYIMVDSVEETARTVVANGCEIVQPIGAGCPGRSPLASAIRPGTSLGSTRNRTAERAGQSKYCRWPLIAHSHSYWFADRLRDSRVHRPGTRFATSDELVTTTQEPLMFTRRDWLKTAAAVPMSGGLRSRPPGTPSANDLESSCRQGR